MLRSSELDTSIFRYDVCHAGGHQPYSAVIIIAFQKGDRLAHKTADSSVRQDSLKSISHFNSVAVVLHREKNQHAAVAALLAKSPLSKQVDGITLDVTPIESIDENDCYFGMCLLVNLPAHIVERVFRRGTQHMREIVDVVCWMELRNRLGKSQGGEAEKCRSNDDKPQTPHRADCTGDCVARAPSPATMSTFQNLNVGYRDGLDYPEYSNPFTNSTTARSAKLPS